MGLRDKIDAVHRDLARKRTATPVTAGDHRARARLMAVAGDDVFQLARTAAAGQLGLLPFESLDPGVLDLRRAVVAWALAQAHGDVRLARILGEALARRGLVVEG